MLRGVSTSSGFAIGDAVILEEFNLFRPIESLSEGQLEYEVLRFKKAVTEAKEQLQEIESDFRRDIDQKSADIFVAQQMFLEDPVLIDGVINQIKASKVNVEHIVKEIFDTYADIFKEMEDPYLRERADDIRDVGNRILSNLLGVESIRAYIREKSIVIAKALSPSSLAQLDRHKVIGIAVEEGGPTSHTAILARTLGIPAVVGVKNLISMVSNGDKVVVDGQEGVIYLNPDEEVLTAYHLKEISWQKEQEELARQKDLSSVTPDGYRLSLMANIGMLADIPLVKSGNAEGIGLFRTEFLYLDRDSFPNEEEQFQAYRDVAMQMKDRPVIIRTLDIGGDKQLSYFPLPKEDNPFLGLRAIRLSLQNIELFKIQLRAILRASSYGEIKIMYPMVSRVEEVREANQLLRECQQELKKEGYAFKENIEVGIMVETPAVAIAADVFAQEVDFFSIGTNDLVQYTLAVDRMNHDIAYLYDHYHPSVFRLIKMVIEAAHEQGIWTGVCGEMAADILCTPVFLGMEVDELSMNASSIPEVKRVVRSVSLSKAQEVMNRVLSFGSGQDVKEYLQQYNENMEGISDESHSSSGS